MSPFLTGFTSELVKLGAFPQQSEGESAYDSSTSEVLDSVMGTGIKTGLKTGQNTATAPASRSRAPTPLTTPNQMVNYTAKSQDE
jgi:hypothetical protein